MLDRRISKLKENLLRQMDEAPVVRHLVDANPRGEDGSTDDRGWHDETP